MNQQSGIIYQSCGMPMKEESDFGTNSDGSKNNGYCVYCFQKGQFARPDITLDQMIKGVVGMMVKYGTVEEEARKNAQSLIPTLKRWHK
jgi:hypothetical protein